jgi:indole-3-glycerol phosphate synthase
VGSYLDRIVAAHRQAAALDDRSLDALLGAAALSAPPRPFAAALCGEGVSVVAEFKRASPSKGVIAKDADPAAVARAYEDGGAQAVSVLTDASFFAGSAEDLGAARAATSLPVLRKDFTVCRADLCDARLMGADAVLLIVAVLEDAELRALGRCARELGLGTVVEVHEAGELGRVRALLDGGALPEPAVIGVNQRDLRSFAVDPWRAARLRPLIPEGVVALAESGIEGPADVARLADAGYDAVLVGEALMRAPDKAGAVAALRAAGGALTPGMR